MQLLSFLKGRQEALLEEWQQSVVAPARGRGGAVYADPVGDAIRRELQSLYSALVGSRDESAVIASLDAVLRIRAVQSMTPSEAVSFLVRLREALAETFRKEYLPEVGDIAAAYEEYTQLLAQVESWMLHAFDIYMKCREDLHRIHIQELMVYGSQEAMPAGSCPSSLLNGAERGRETSHANHNGGER